MHSCTSFAPIVDARSNVLILGSMPGVRSLMLRQYYGHPQNRFWPMIAAVCEEPFLPDAYDDRLQILRKHRIALWDVLASCEREGSLDSAISDEQSNDFAAFFQEFPKIKKICFNGGKAHQAFKKYHKALLADLHIEAIALPSTSPANARWRLSTLVDAWRGALFPPCQRRFDSPRNA